MRKSTISFFHPLAKLSLPRAFCHSAHVITVMAAARHSWRRCCLVSALMVCSWAVRVCTCRSPHPAWQRQVKTVFSSCTMRFAISTIRAASSSMAAVAARCRRGPGRDRGGTHRELRHGWKPSSPTMFRRVRKSTSVHNEVVQAPSNSNQVVFTMKSSAHC